MLIKEACETCGVTRKAVEYYERQTMIHPEVLRTSSGRKRRVSGGVSLGVLLESRIMRSTVISATCVRCIGPKPARKV